jgi:NMD protein affecting ribosome stability and mRNA decay
MLEYANTTCPYCSTALDPLPAAPGDCPACGATIWVRGGPDGLTYLLQEVDLPVLEQAWQEADDARHREAIAEATARGRASFEAAIAEARELGIAEVEYLVADHACAVCQRLSRRTMDVGVAPPLPIAGCRNELCRCEVIAAI